VGATARMIHLLWGLPALALVAAFGWAVARRALGEDDAVAAASFAGAASLAGFGLCLNFWSHAGLRFNAACALSALTLGAGAWLLRRLPAAPPLSLSKPGRSAIWALCFVCFLLLYVPALIRLDLHDVIDLHAPLALSYQRDRFPTEYPYFPFETLHYHHGSDLLGAALSRMLGMNVYASFQLLTFLCGLILYGAVLTLSRRFTERRGLAHLAALMAIAGGGLSWIYVFDTGNEDWWTNGWYRAIRAGDGLDLRTIPLFIDIFYQKSTCVGLAILSAVLLWSERALASGSRPALVSAGVALGFLDLGHAVLYLLLTCGLLFRGALAALRARRWSPETARILLIVALGAAVALSGGGLLAHGRPGEGMALQPHLYLAAGADGALTAVWRYLETFGVPLLLFPVAIALAWRRRDDLALTVAVMAGGSLLAPHLFAYRGGWGPAKYFALKLFPFAVAWMTWLLPLVFDRMLAAGSVARRRVLVGACAFAACAAPLIFAAHMGVYSGRVARPGYPESPGDLAAARYLAPRVQNDEMVLTPHTGLARYGGLRTPLFAVNVAESGYDPDRVAEVRRLLEALYDRLPDEVLLAWRMRYVCIAPDEMRRFGRAALARLASPSFELETTLEDGNETRRIYRYRGGEGAIPIAVRGP
jgi:hypothetical protein